MNAAIRIGRAIMQNEGFIQRSESLFIAYFFTQYHIYMATVEVHYNVQQVYF
ncbi:Uncharacterised protein [Enterobacter cloacae]|nr:Uncharacterised protein [Enterobacter cloacae]